MLFNRINPLLAVNLLINLYFLSVVASLPAKGSGVGVRKGFRRVGGAIVVIEEVVYKK